MSIAQIDIHHLRSIVSARLKTHPRYNFIYGDNGSGKTTLLEAIYLLSHGVSFRTRELNALISFNASTLTLFSHLSSGDTVSIEKSKAGIKAFLNQHSCVRRSELVEFLPCQIFYQDIFNIIDAGPQVRRSVLDWGLFHVKHEYHDLWKNYRRVLKHRNALLRQKADRSVFSAWDKQLVKYSEALHQMRQSYCEKWFDYFQRVLIQLTDECCTLHYDKGWDKKGIQKSLENILEEQFELDKTHQYTHSGAHQADIIIKSDSHKAKQYFSRGQQKIILIALKLSQAKFLPKPGVYLFDDITTELDLKHIERLINYVESIEGQFFFTSIDPSLFKKLYASHQAAFFSVQNGQFMLE